jgi:hypothetical protein
MAERHRMLGLATRHVVDREELPSYRNRSTVLPSFTSVETVPKKR